MSSGLVLIDKPAGLTSHDVVARVRRLAKTRRVGHAGTLDPMATGLLILGVESATKLLTFIVGADKTYQATIRLGATTTTDDRESEFTSLADADLLAKISDEQITLGVRQLTGQIMQVPSSVSAIKVDGKRAYALVRGGDEVKLKSRPITVSRFEITSDIRRFNDQGHDFIEFDATIDCSSGTYIRALARDLGAALNIGGYLTALRRTRIGEYSVENSQDLNDLLKPDSTVELDVLPIAVAAKAQFAVRKLTDQEVIDIRHGKRLSQAGESDDVFAAFSPAGELVALLQRNLDAVKSVVVFAEPQANGKD